MHDSLFLQLILFALCQSLMEIIKNEDRRGSGGITPGRLLKYYMLAGYSAFGVGSDNQIVLILWFEVTAMESCGF